MFDRLTRPQLKAPRLRRPAPLPLKAAMEPAIPMPSVFTRPLEQPPQRKQRKACPACEEEGTACPGCQKKAAPTLERPPAGAQMRRAAVVPGWVAADEASIRGADAYIADLSVARDEHIALAATLEAGAPRLAKAETQFKTAEQIAEDRAREEAATRSIDDAILGALEQELAIANGAVSRLRAEFPSEPAGSPVARKLSHLEDESKRIGKSRDRMKSRANAAALAVVLANLKIEKYRSKGDARAVASIEKAIGVVKRQLRALHSGRHPPGDAGSKGGIPYVVFANHVKVGGEAPWRYNNPGNLGPARAGHAIPSGVIGWRGDLYIFATWLDGLRAIETSYFTQAPAILGIPAQEQELPLRNYLARHYNHTPGYTDQVLAFVPEAHIDPGKPITALTPRQRVALLAGITRREGGLIGPAKRNKGSRRGVVVTCASTGTFASPFKAMLGCGP